MPENYRIAIVGAGSLRGKELNEALGESAFAASDFVLLDDESSLGKVEAVGDEVTVVQMIDPQSFDHADFVFFAGDAGNTLKHWKSASRSGASILDLTYALEGEPDVLVRSPWVREELNGLSSGKATPDLRTPAIVPAHPAAVALALLLLRVKKVGPVASAWATVLEPATEHGRSAMDELHQQTISLLSFQPLPKETYDAQVAFNLLPVLGEEAKVDLGATELRIRRHYGLLSGGGLPQVSVQLIHAPVFHGYGISLGIELEQPASVEELEAALTGEHVDVVLGDQDAPSNLSTAGEEDIMVRVRGEEGRQRFWIWAAADNLKLSALNAVACALELRKLRPQGKVQ
ncbi:Aspartate-semialdehyde dehydrogenase [Acidisarcina polymorpha]|uniref:Aspartate-semialdehyde dehydrogenase n=1 Tax=Acidisarcina polymorpha TaxID=2211140 RepID=A0A2Z5G743_9BACT|nr:Asd/ArgC dimerization domain-containing protein [Acidisarcina polymorpha]AXC14828.1 Aspartate-semialdehyde dehydrogenase [Acidisarcina polymorpha]